MADENNNVFKLDYGVHTFTFDKNRISNAKMQRLKLLEEASEAVEAARALDSSSYNDPYYAIKRAHLEDEIADVISAACNLAAYAGLTGDEINQALKRNYQRCVRRGYVKTSDD